MSDSLINGRKVRLFNVIDDCNREALLVNAQSSYPACMVIEKLEDLGKEIGLPEYIRCDNAPEFISKTFIKWCEKHSIEIRYIQPGKPVQNGFIERFNRFFREDILDAYYFKSIEQLQSLADDWVMDYNKHHPHKGIGNKPPQIFRQRTYGEFKFPVGSDKIENIFPNFVPS